MARQTGRATRILSEEERRELLRRREKKKRFQKIDAPPPRGPQFVPFLLSILAIAVILYQLFGPKLDLGLDFLDVEDGEGLDVADGEAPPAPDARRDPATFRDGIQALETRLFSPDLGDESLTGLGEALALDLDALATRFRADQTERFDNAAATLEAMAAEVSTGVDTRRLQDVRQRWDDLRGDLFQPADWFHSGSVDADEQRELTFATYRQSASEVLDLVEDALSEVVTALSERPTETDGPAISDSWRDFAAEWHERRANLTQQQLPRPDASATDAQILAIQEYEQRVGEVGGLVSAERPPSEAMLRTLEDAQIAWRQLVDRFDTLVESVEP